MPKFSKKLVDSPHNQVSSSINRLNMDKIVNRADAVIKSNRIVSFNSCKTEKYKELGLFSNGKVIYL